MFANGSSKRLLGLASPGLIGAQGKPNRPAPTTRGAGHFGRGVRGRGGEGRGGGGEEGESALGPIQYRICISRFDSTNPRGVFGSPGSRKRTLK